MAILKGAEPYLLRGGNTGILLIHSFTGSPAELRLLANFLNEQGYTVAVPLLPGHGTQVSDLLDKKWPDWYKAVEKNYTELKKSCTKVYVAGLCLGGLLALYLAARQQVDKLCVMATPLALCDKRAFLIPWAQYFRKYIPKGRRFYTIDAIYNVSYSKYPLPALASMLGLVKEVKKVLPSIVNPCMVMQSKVEKTVHPQSAQYIYKRLGSLDKQLYWFNKSGHMLVLDQERQEVSQVIYKFFEGAANERGQ